jgi:hypothetical protein
MTDDKSLAEAIGERAGLTVVDAANAPFIYFEEAPALGHVNGLIRVTLTAERVLLNKGVPVGEQVVTGYLRTNIQGARALIDALNSALLMAIPVEKPEGPAN